MARIHHRHRARILAVWNNLCGLCDTRPSDLSDIEIHHIKAQKSGGSDEETNLVPLCLLCHTMVRKGTIKLDEKKLFDKLKILLDKTDK